MQNPTVTACICAFVKTTDILRFSFVLNSLVLRIKSCWVSYPRLSLAAARLERDTHRNRLDAGYNPARLKREKKAEDAEKDLIEKSAETVGQLINEFFHAEINDQVKTAIPIKQAMDKYILENLGELKIEAKRSDFDLINATSRHEEERCYYICPIILH